MLLFIAGLMVGGFVGVLMMAVCIVGRSSDY